MTQQKKSKFGRIGAALILTGIFSLVFSIYFTSQILAFAGLGLTFWGILFVLITPIGYLQTSVVESTISSSYRTIDRMIGDLGQKGMGYHIPLFPKDAVLPGNLKVLEEVVLYIPAEEASLLIPSLGELASNKFMPENPRGVVITPPGLGLLNYIEKKLNVDFARMSLSDLCETMPRYIVNDCGLAKDIRISFKENEVSLKAVELAFRSLYSGENNFKCINLIGCPVINSIACAIAKSQGKPVFIRNVTSSTNDLTIDAIFGIIER